MASKKKNTTAKPQSAPKRFHDVKSMGLWRDIASCLLYKDTDKHDESTVNEVATLLRLQTQLIAENWKEIDRIASKNEEVDISWKFKINRANVPVEVKVTGSFSESHSMKAASDLPDPNQDNLPGVSEEETEDREEEKREIVEEGPDSETK